MQTTILFLFFTLFYACKPILHSEHSNTHISEIYDIAKQYHDICQYDSLRKYKDSVIKSEYHDTFDFKNFRAIKKKLNPSNYLIEYDKKNQIIGLTHYAENKLKLIFRMKSFHTEKFIISNLQLCHDEKELLDSLIFYSACFFVYEKSTKKNYLIFTDNPKYRFSNTYNISKLETITRIAFLDDNLFMTHLFRFSKGKLKSASLIYFDKDYAIKGENIILTKELEQGEPNIKPNLSFRELDILYKTNESKARKAHILESISENYYKNTPLWKSEADHRLEIEGVVVDTNNIILPIWENNIIEKK